MFEKYIHIERLDHPTTQGILDGTCYVFEKFDGVNGSIWLEDGRIRAGSSNRELSASADNFGFYKYCKSNHRLAKFLSKFDEGTIVYGEWMPTVKNYPNEIFRTFQIFDVKEHGKYLPYYKWWRLAEASQVDYIKPIKTGKFTKEDILKLASLHEEGVIIKNYELLNNLGTYVAAKVINKNFCSSTVNNNKPKYADKKLYDIVDKHITYNLILKSIGGKLQNDYDRKNLINNVFFFFIHEELYKVIEKEINIVINFKVLKKLVTEKIKQTLPELFS